MHVATIKKNNLYFETGYGEILGYADKEYKSAGANIVSREKVMNKDVICDPKIGDQGSSRKRASFASFSKK